MSPQMLEASLHAYEKVAALTSALAVVIFTARLSVLAVTASSPTAYSDALKSLVAFFISLALAPVVFKAIIFSSGDLAAHISKFANTTVPETETQGSVFSELMKVMAHESPFLSFVIDVIPYSVSHIANTVYSVLLGTLCSATPVILLYFELSNSSQSLRAVATSVLVLSSWPILWNLMALLAHELWSSYSHTTVSTIVFWSVVKCLQLASPILSVLFFKSLSMAGTEKVKGYASAGVSVARGAGSNIKGKLFK